MASRACSEEEQNGNEYDVIEVMITSYTASVILLVEAVMV